MFGTLVDDVRTALPRIETGGRGAGPVAAGLVAAALLAAPDGLAAQAEAAPTSGTVDVTLRGGLGIPVDGDALDAITKTGGSFGGGVSFHLSPLFAVGADVDYQLLEGDTDAGVLFPDMSLLHATGGAEFHFLSPETRWNGVLSVGAGITRLDMSETVDTGATAPAAIDHTGLTFRVATELGYRVSDGASIFVEPGVYLMTLDRTVVRNIALASPSVTGAFDVGWVVPIQAGVRLSLD